MAHSTKYIKCIFLNKTCYNIQNVRAFHTDSYYGKFKHWI